MKPRIWGAVALLAVAALVPLPAAAQKLYAASVRSIAEGGADVLGGALYSVDLAAVTTTFIAPIRLNGGRGVGITGLAVHPASAVFYGITSPLSRNDPFSLVTIDPRNGDARLIGPLRFGGSDIAFNRAGILFTWLPGTSQLGVVNIESGEVTPIGDSGPAGPPAGMAIDADGVAYITAKGATGTLDTVDIATGMQKTGPPLTGAPFDSTINSMTFTPNGVLLAVNSNSGVPATARLVTINVVTGVVTSIGNLPDDTDGLAFSNDPPKEQVPTDWRIYALWSLAGIGAILAGVGWWVDRKPKAKPPA